MKYLLTVCMFLMSASIFAQVDCEKMKSRIDNLANKGKQNSRRAKKLEKKYDHFCVQNLDKASWKAKRKSFRDSWKSNKDGNKKLHRCTRLNFKLKRATKNGKTRRIKRIEKRMEKHNCEVQQ